MWVGELGRLLASLEADIRKLPPFEPRFSLNNQRQEITALTAEVQSIIIAANARVASPDSIARMSILCVSFQLFGSHGCLDSFNDRHMSFTHSLTHSLDWSVGYDQDFDKSTLEPGNWSTKSCS